MGIVGFANRKPPGCQNFYHIFVDFFRKMRIIYFRMDKKKDCKIPQCGNLPDHKTDKVVVGAKQLRKAVASGRASRVYLAKDADPSLVEPLQALCVEHHIQITWVPDRNALGRACGIEVAAAAAAVVTEA